MRIKCTLAFVGGTTLELSVDSFMVDPTARILAMQDGADQYAFPLENLKYWKVTKPGVVN